MNVFRIWYGLCKQHIPLLYYLDKAHVSNSRPVGQIRPRAKFSSGPHISLGSQQILAFLYVRQHQKDRNCNYATLITEFGRFSDFNIQKFPQKQRVCIFRPVKQVVVKYVIIVHLWRNFFDDFCRPNCKWPSCMRHATIQSTFFDFQLNKSMSIN